MAPDDPSSQFVEYVFLIVVIGISGIAIIAGLAWAWRNFLRRQRALEQRHASRVSPSPHVDAWQSAADRVEEPGRERPPGYPFTGEGTNDINENDETWRDSYEDDERDEPGDDSDDDAPPWS